MATPADGTAGAAQQGPYLPESFRRLQEVEQKVIQAVELSGETMQELSKMGSADKATTTQLVKKFLENVRDVKVELNQAIINNPAGFVNRSSDYVSKFAASNAATKVDVVLLYVERMQGILDSTGHQEPIATAGADQEGAVKEETVEVEEEPEAMQID